MPSPPDCTRNPLVAIVGPTGSGKSELAVRIAEHLDGEIVNCDSMQIYKGFDIGTAKIPMAERRSIPHHLLDFVTPEQVFSAGDYARTARVAIAGIAERGRVPVLAGGTGFYLRALLDGLPELPGRDAGLRQRLSRKGPEQLHRLLARLDQGAAARLHRNDTVRVIRAIEIRLLGGRVVPVPEANLGMPEFSVRKIGLFPPREELYRRLDARTGRMFSDGLLEEVSALLRAGVPRDAKPFDAVGYRQALAAVEGRSSIEDAVAEARQATRNYAKRQMTWFRHDAGVEPRFEFGGAVSELDFQKETKMPPEVI